MTRIRINTDLAKAASQRLVTASDNLDEAVQTLHRAVGELDVGVWDGVSRTRAEPLLSQVNPSNWTLADEVRGMGQKLHRVAEAFEEKDAAATRRMAEMPWVDFESGSGGAVVVPLETPASGVSQDGLSFIARHEGMRLELYNDPGNHCTIGVGHLVHTGPCDGRASETPFANGLTEEEALELFRNDVTTYEQTVRELVQVPLTQNQFDALVSLTYNIGPGGFADSHVLENLNAGNYDAIPDSFREHVHAFHGPVLPGLVRRREEEIKLFMDGTY